VRRVVVLAAALVLSSSWAQGWPGTGTFVSQALPPGNGRVARAVSQIAMPTALSRTEIANLAAAGSVRRSIAVQVGSRAFLGTAVLGGSLIVGALTWFYDEVQRSASPELDDWWANQGGGGGSWPDFPPYAQWLGQGQTKTTPSAFNSAMFAASGGAYAVASGSFGYQITNDLYGDGKYYGNVWDAAVGYVRVTARYAPAECGGFGTACLTFMHALLEAHYAGIQGGGQSLVDFLTANGAQAEVLRDEVLRPYLEETLDPEADPNTMANPWQGVDVTIQPPVSWPVWTGDPYADAPDADTDDDGWPDWIEWRLGTDPFSAASRPLAGSDPDGDGRTNAQERDAVTDPLDGTEYDANQAPAADPNAEPVASDLEAVTEAIQALEAELAELLANVSTESMQTVQVSVAEAQLAELEAIRELLEGEDQAPVLEGPALEELTDTPWTALSATVSTALADLRDTASTRMPFALEGFIPTPTITGSSSCAAVAMPILGVSQDVGLCETPVHDFMAGPGRAVLLALAVVAFWLSAASVVAKS
jgi:hypothetical protein